MHRMLLRALLFAALAHGGAADTAGSEEHELLVQAAAPPFVLGLTPAAPAAMQVRVAQLPKTVRSTVAISQFQVLPLSRLARRPLRTAASAAGAATWPSIAMASITCSQRP